MATIYAPNVSMTGTVTGTSTVQDPPAAGEPPRPPTGPPPTRPALFRHLHHSHSLDHLESPSTQSPESPEFPESPGSLESLEPPDSQEDDMISHYDQYNVSFLVKAIKLLMVV